MNEVLNNYIQQIKADLEINQINIADVARKLPARRHHWAARLIEHKIKINELEKQKSNIIKEVSAKIGRDSPVLMSSKTIQNAAESSNDIQSINEQIATNKLIVEFLEQVQKNFFSASHDVRNIVEIMKLEQL
jgi:hypothetical protein